MNSVFRSRDATSCQYTGCFPSQLPALNYQKSQSPLSQYKFTLSLILFKSLFLGLMLWCNKLGCCVGTHILWQSAWDGVLPVFLIQLSGDAHSGRQQVMVTQVLGHLSPSGVGGSSSWLWPGLFLAIVGIASFTNQKILYWVFSLSLFLTLSLLPSPPLQINKWLSKALLLNILERSFAEIILCSQCLPIAAF